MLPVMLDVSEKKCTVIGGGKAAWIKAKTLLENGADVTVISETLDEKFDGMNIKHIQRPYRNGDTKNAFLVIAATNDPEINRRVKTESENGDTKLFMSADGKNSDLMFMAHTQSGDTKIAVSTNGAYPMLGARICEELSDTCKKYDNLIGVLSEYRKKIIRSSLDHDEKMELLKSLISDELLNLQDINEFKKKGGKLIEKTLEN